MLDRNRLINTGYTHTRLTARRAQLTKEDASVGYNQDPVLIAIMATTPPPPPSPVHAPPTPLHGAKHDFYEPYSTRRSTRSVSKRAQDNKPVFSTHTFSPPSSAQSSPKRGTRKVTMSEELTSVHQTEHSVTAGMTLDVAGLLLPDGRTTVPPTTMLPTPAKTPRKRPQQPAHTFRSTARVLFQNGSDVADGAMTTPRKHRDGRRLSLSLDNSMMNGLDGGDQDGAIQIFTDSKERIPEVDPSEANPFYAKGQPSGAVETNHKRRRVAKNVEIEKGIRREDGTVYVLYVSMLLMMDILATDRYTSRGKKIFRKFNDDEVDEEEYESEDLGGMDLDRAGSQPTRPLTRSSIKPRLLFPTEGQQRERELNIHGEEEEDQDADEEAITDIDENALNRSMVETLTDNEADEHIDNGTLAPPTALPVTPSAGSPLTPASASAVMTRTTRSSTRKASKGHQSPLAKVRDRRSPRVMKHKGDKVSPFDEWRRTKSSMEVLKKGKNKRVGDTLEQNGRMTSMKKAKIGKT